MKNAGGFAAASGGESEDGEDNIEVGADDAQEAEQEEEQEGQEEESDTQIQQGQFERIAGLSINRARVYEELIKAEQADAQGRADEKPEPEPEPEVETLDEGGAYRALEGKPLEYDATGRMIRPADQIPLPERKPEVIAPTAKGNELLDLIGQLESSDNYNIIVGGTEKPLTQMTVKAVRKLQRELSQKNLGTAVGRYQIIDDKMGDLVRWMGIDEDETFDESLQDRMGRELLKRRGV